MPTMTNRQRFDAYMAGWRRGASRQSIPPEIAANENIDEKESWERGYVAGQKEHHATSDRVAEFLGVKLATITT